MFTDITFEILTTSSLFGPKTAIYCQNWNYLGSSAKLRIWQVPACKIDPQSGYFSCNNPPNNPPTYPPGKFERLYLSIVLLLLSMLCSVPTPIFPLINKVCVVSPPPHPNVVLCLCITRLSLGFYARTSEQIFMCVVHPVGHFGLSRRLVFAGGAALQAVSECTRRR